MAIEEKRRPNRHRKLKKSAPGSKRGIQVHILHERGEVVSTKSTRERKKRKKDLYEGRKGKQGIKPC